MCTRAPADLAYADRPVLVGVLKLLVRRRTETPRDRVNFS